MTVDPVTQSYNESLTEGFRRPNPVPHTLAVLRRWIGTGGRVLDVGCGSGYMGGLIAGWGNEVDGVEISPAAIEAARARSVNALVGDVEEPLPAGGAPYPVVTCMEVLEHLVHPDRTLAHIARVIAPTGRLVVSVPNTAFWAHRLMGLFGRLVFVGEGKFPAAAEPHIRHYTLATLRAILEASGFSIAEVRGTFTGFPGTLRPYLPFPADKAVGGIQRITRGLDGLCDGLPSIASGGLLVLARLRPGAPLVPVPETRRVRLRLHASGDSVVVGGDDGGWIDPQAPLPLADASATRVEIGPDWTRLLTPTPLLAACVRLLRPGGRLAVRVDDAAAWRRRLALLAGCFPPSSDRSPSAAWRDPTIRFFTARSLAETLAACGLASVAVHRVRERGQPMLLGEAIVRR